MENLFNPILKSLPALYQHGSGPAGRQGGPPLLTLPLRYGFQMQIPKVDIFGKCF
jgi:hypothetical protein